MKKKTSFFKPPHLLLVKNPDNQFAVEEVLIWGANPELGKLSFYHVVSESNLTPLTIINLVMGSYEIGDLINAEIIDNLSSEEIAIQIFGDLFEDGDKTPDAVVVFFDEELDWYGFVSAFGKKNIAGMNVPMKEVMNLKFENLKAIQQPAIDDLADSLKGKVGEISPLPQSLVYQLFDFNFVTK